MNKNDPRAPHQPASGHTPLFGKRILVTRARAQSQDITSQLEALGANVVHCPTIEIIPPSSWAPLDAAIARLNEYDWLVFTSANGVYFFFRRLEELRSDAVSTLGTILICAIGPVTANAVEREGALVRITAADSRGEGVLAAIVDHVGGDENIRGLRFLIPRARVAREALTDGLRKLGAKVEAVETYQTVQPDVSPESITRLFDDASIDAITFTSPSTVSNFARLVGLTDLSDLLARTLVTCIGPVTAETAANFGLRSIVQPERHTTAQLVGSIVKAIGRE